MAREEKRAETRVRVEREESKIVSVAESGAAAGGGGCFGIACGEWDEAGDGGPSGKDMEGKDEVMEEGMWTSSHFWDSSPVSCREWVE